MGESRTPGEKALRPNMWVVSEAFRQNHDHVCKCGDGRTSRCTTEYLIMYVYSNPEVIGLANLQLNGKSVRVGVVGVADLDLISGSGVQNFAGNTMI